MCEKNETPLYIYIFTQKNKKVCILCATLAIVLLYLYVAMEKGRSAVKCAVLKMGQEGQVFFPRWPISAAGHLSSSAFSSFWTSESRGGFSFTLQEMEKSQAIVFVQ